MPDMVLLSQSKVRTFLTCRRRFELRYLHRVPWPAAPLAEKDEALLGRGQQFHELLHRHFLGLPMEAESIDDAQVRGWWRTFRQEGPRLPNGRYLPELTLTIPLGALLLNGRFDLLIIGTDTAPPTAHIYDWKTGHPRHLADLRHDWQTRLYLALIAEGGAALGHTFAPEQIHLTYWYAVAPNEPRTIAYTADWHRQNWQEISQIGQQIEQAMQTNEWPLTDNWDECRTCGFQTYCHRASQPAAADEADLEAEDTPELPSAIWLEPHLP
jgi:CRISPR/Cas system-associated exonuclease Cas4 (RecB family)